MHRYSSSGLPGLASLHRAVGDFLRERLRNQTAADSVWPRRIPVGLRFFGLVCLCASLLIPLKGRAQHYTFAQFGQNDGLLNQDVSAIVQDGRGVLWVGTENGVFLADSSHFVKVQSYRGAEEGSVLAMHVDGAGRVWVAGTKHLAYFTPDRVIHVVAPIGLDQLLDGEVAISSLPALPDAVYLLMNGHLQRVRREGGGEKWAMEDVFAAATLSRHPALTRPSGLAADPARGALWMGCDSGLCEVEIPRAEAVATAPQVTEWNAARGIPKNRWSRVLVARDGQVWARGGGDVLRLNPRTWGVDRFGDPGGKEDIRYSQITEDVDGSILATLPNGLARLEDGRWTRLTAANGLPPSQLVTMFFDKQGGFWLAPVGGGIWRWLGYGNWQNWARFEGVDGNVTWAMLRDRGGRMWAAASGNLLRIDEHAGRALPQKARARMGDIETLAEDARGHLWSGSATGAVLDYDPGRERIRELQPNLGFVYRLKQDAGAARIWLCTGKGVAYVSAADGWAEVHRVTARGAPQVNVWSVAQDRFGTLWFTAKGGLYRMEKDVWTPVLLPSEAGRTDYPSLESAPDGTLWMQGASPYPLLHLRVAGDRARLIGAVPEALIGTDDISFIRFDRRGWLWVGTDSGVYVFDGNRWVHCRQEDGLVSDDTNTGAIYEDGDGSMWFGTVGGLSHLLQPGELFRVPAPQIGVRDVRLNGIALHAGAGPRFNVRAPELTAELFSTDYKRPRAVVFRYRLRGLVDAWQSSTNGSLRFSALAPGDYVLSLQAMDVRVHAYSEPVDYAFTVLPPWYRRDRAKVSALILALLVGTVWWKVSLHRLKTSEATLKRKVDEQTAQLLAEKEHLERAQRELLESSRRDALTGLLNRSAIFEVLSRMRWRALESGAPLCVIMADLDHFKSINDRCGHMVGDAVLRECAERFQETLRPDDFVGRYGGEEVLIVIPGLYPEQASARLEDIREAIALRPVVHGAHTVPVTCSFGVAWLSERNREVESVVHDADAALYMAKQNGRNRVEFAPELEDAVYTRRHPPESVEGVGPQESMEFPVVEVERE